MFWRLFLAGSLLIFIEGLVVSRSSNAAADAGPPMFSNGPSTPGEMNWQINIATTLAISYHADRMHEFPLLDINYGWGPRMQLKVETGWIFSKQHGSPSDSGMGNTLIGYKWRFLDDKESYCSMSIYPQASFHLIPAGNYQLQSAGDSLILPVEASKHFGDYNLNLELGLVLASTDPNKMFYGAVIGYDFEQDADLLFELQGITPFNSTGTQVAANLGAKFRIRKSFSVIASIGHTLLQLTNQNAQILAYLGVQLHL